jgi:phosphoglycerate dehydrogenase-like enzyme
MIVMNTPFGNSITTAEHAIAMMFAVARQIPEASASTHAGKWEKSKLHGRGTDRQDAGRDRRGQYRVHRHATARWAFG